VRPPLRDGGIAIVLVWNYRLSGIRRQAITIIDEGVVWGGMPSLRHSVVIASIVAALFAALTVALPILPRAAAQPIEPLQSARPVVPPAPPDVAEAPPQATRTASGLAWRLLAKGEGTAHPGAHDKVSLVFTAWTAEGDVIDSSIPDGEPRPFLMDDVVKGLAEGLRLMGKGEKRRLWIPAALASPGRPKRRGPASACVIDVELVDFVKMPDPVPVPEDVEAAPADAKRTPSGLAYKFLKHGKGKEHPKADSTVEVHYSGWTPDGHLFDSSVRRGQPISFPLNGVIKGWTEGVQLMVAGDKVRFWIPGALAYGDTPSRAGAPAGPLVFDVELLSIQ
jgi:peptidylprolyl isomerase